MSSTTLVGRKISTWSPHLLLLDKPPSGTLVTKRPQANKVVDVTSQHWSRFVTRTRIRRQGQQEQGKGGETQRALPLLLVPDHVTDGCPSNNYLGLTIATDLNFESKKIYQETLNNLD